MKRQGSTGRCPVCRAALPSPATIFGESDCPRCQARLWHLVLDSGPKFYVRRPRETVYDLITDLAGPHPEFLTEELQTLLDGADSLDVYEIMRRIEDAR